MNRFEKVSFSQYTADRLPMILQAECDGSVKRGSEQAAMEQKTMEHEAMEQVRAEYDAICMPRRATAGSAGYDLHTPFAFTLEPGQVKVIPTGLRVQMEEDLWLGIYIRSGLGFKYQIRLVNSTAVIDSDYYGADNEGHLKVGIYNGGQRALTLSAGDAFAQGILQPYLCMDDDEPLSDRRRGGFGSTDRKTD